MEHRVTHTQKKKKKKDIHDVNLDFLKYNIL